jgi:hypothetical protein
MLRKPGIRRHTRRTFTLADGSQIMRFMGDLLFRSNVVKEPHRSFSGKKGTALAWELSLESLGFFSML